MGAKAKSKTVGKQMSELWQQLESRDIADVLEEAGGRVAACMKEVEACEHEQQLLENEWEEGNAAYQDASFKVEEIAGREAAAALDILKAAGAAESAAALALQRTKEFHTDTSQAFKLLEMEAERKQKLLELDGAKRVAHEAVESARKAVEESKLKEKEVLQAWKETGKQSSANDGTNDGLQDPEAMPECSHENKEIDRAHNTMMAELADIEKSRCMREKARQRKKNELAAEGKAKAKGKGKSKAAVRQHQEMEGTAPESPLSKAARTTSDVQ